MLHRNKITAKRSLTFKLVVSMTLIVAGTFIFCWLLNHLFLEKIYENNKQRELISAYSLVANAYTENTLSDENFQLEFQRAYTNGNLDIILAKNKRVLLSSASNRNLLLEQYQEIVEGLNNGLLQNEVIDKGNYVITRQSDSSLKEEYLILYGIAGNSGEVFMRTPVKSLKESAAITSMFLGITGAAAVLISILVIILISRSISKPIRNLSDISFKMAGLEFETKYVSDRNCSREIDELGNNINILSGSLESTISNLKSANNELKKDIEKKEQIDEMRKDFLSNVSHELKTPLALIEGYAEGLKECVNDDEENRNFYCDVIIDESSKMNSMVQKLISLNKLESGNEMIQFKRFDLQEIVAGVLDNSKIIFENNGIKVSHNCSRPVFVWGDEFLIEEVVTNYISNAIHHVKGSREIRIDYEEYNDKLRWSVYNTGDQIPDAELEKIWIKFYKVDKARTREYGGSGIGLSIVKAIMELHHQNCGLVNCVDGVKFWIELDNNI